MNRNPLGLRAGLGLPPVRRAAILPPFRVPDLGVLFVLPSLAVVGLILKMVVAT